MRPPPRRRAAERAQAFAAHASRRQLIAVAADGLDAVGRLAAWARGQPWGWHR